MIVYRRMNNRFITLTICIITCLTLVGCGSAAVNADIPKDELETTLTDSVDSDREDIEKPSEKMVINSLSVEDAETISGSLGSPVVTVECQDYDGNGTNEAFVVLGKQDEFGGYLVDQLWFISSDKKTKMLKDDFNDLSMYINNDGYYMDYPDEKKGFFYADFGGHGSGWITLIYGVKDGQPFELDISMKTEGFYQDTPGQFYTLTDNFDDGHVYLITPLKFNKETGQFEKGEPTGEKKWENTESSNEASDLIDAFIRGEIDAESSDEGRAPINISELENNEEEWLRYEVGDRIDIDSDGEDELIMNGPYGGMILDARDNKVYILTEGDGMAAVLSVAKLDNEFWVVHADTSHSGRQMYFLDKYNGRGEITDSTTLSAEYWDSPNDQYDEDSDFMFRDKPITMEEFERIRDEMYMWTNSN